MARRVFFSFHYSRDVRRIMQVRNSWVVRPEGEATPFYDAAEFEEAKRRAGGIDPEAAAVFELPHSQPLLHSVPSVRGVGARLAR